MSPRKIITQPNKVNFFKDFIMKTQLTMTFSTTYPSGARTIADFPLYGQELDLVLSGGHSVRINNYRLDLRSSSNYFVGLVEQMNSLCREALLVGTDFALGWEHERGADMLVNVGGIYKCRPSDDAEILIRPLRGPFHDEVEVVIIPLKRGMPQLHFIFTLSGRKRLWPLSVHLGVRKLLEASYTGLKPALVG